MAKPANLTWDQAVTQVSNELAALEAQLAARRSQCAQLQALLAECNAQAIELQRQIADKQTVLNWCRAQQ